MKCENFLDINELVLGADVANTGCENVNDFVDTEETSMVDILKKWLARPIVEKCRVVGDSILKTW